MKRREMVLNIASAGALAALGAGAALAGNIDPSRRLYGTPRSLSLRRRPRRRERLLTLALARSDVPTGVWEEAGALAQLAAEALQEPERARRLAEDPHGALRELGYEPAALRLDAPEIRACLLLADPELRAAVDRDDAAAFIRLLRERGVEPAPDDSTLARALRQALAEDASLGLASSSEPGPDGSTSPAYTAVVFVTALAAVIVGVLVVVGVTVVAVSYTVVSVSGGGTGRRRGTDDLSSAMLALQSGNAELARRVRQQIIEERLDGLTEAAMEAARARGIMLEWQEAERQVRVAIERVMRY
jgi:hypothetical protein